jgi:hypothetical protein
MVPRKKRRLQKEQQPFAFCPLSAKGDGEEDVDPLESDGWEPNADDLMENMEDLEEEEEDEFNLDDVESSVTGAKEDEYDDDDIDYEDDFDTEQDADDAKEDVDDDDEDDGIDEEDEDIEEAGDEDEDEDEFDIESKEELDALLRSSGLSDKPPDDFSNWWEDYGYETKEDMEKNVLFPGGMAGLVNPFEPPDADFWEDSVTMVPLEEDPEDEGYNANLKTILENSAKRRAAADLIAAEEQIELSRKMDTFYDDEEDVQEKAIQAELQTIDELSAALDEAIPGDPNGDNEAIALDISDFDGMDIEKEVMESPALFDDEPYIGNNRTNIAGTGVTDGDMEALDKSWKNIKEATTKEPWNKVEATKFDFDYDAYPKQYHYDMQETAVEIGSASYDVYPWLKYDMGFNVSNLILAAIKHNKDAPVILQHWYPQLMVCERYQHARDRNFDFTWEDVDNANITELEEYYLGFGYEEIPSKAPSETGLISLEDADEQEIKMAAMEKWMLDVYNSEWDRKDFDDENIKDEDNVFSENFKMPQHPDLPKWEDAQEDIAGWKEEWEPDEEDGEEELDEESIKYRDAMGRTVDFTNAQDDDFQKNFRGHLVVACGPYDEDLEVAERITERMLKEFGNAIYTETKIYKHATPDDNVFEVWLESYEIDLLHSKRRAFMGVDGWEGKGEVDETRMDYLVEQVSHLTSDDARISFRWSEEHVS